MTSRLSSASKDGKKKNSFRRAIKKATTKDGAETENKVGIVGCMENAVRQSKDSKEVFDEINQSSSDSIFSQKEQRVLLQEVLLLAGNKGEYEGELKKLLDFLFHNDKDYDAFSENNLRRQLEIFGDDISDRGYVTWEDVQKYFNKLKPGFDTLLFEIVKLIDKEKQGTSARNKCGNYGAEIYDEKNPLKAFFEAPEEEDDQYEDPELISIDYLNIAKEESGALSILEDVTQALMLPNQPTKPIKRAGSKRRRSSTLKGLVDGKIPVLGNRSEVGSARVGSARRPSEDLGLGQIARRSSKDAGIGIVSRRSSKDSIVGTLNGRRSSKDSGVGISNGRRSSQDLGLGINARRSSKDLGVGIHPSLLLSTRRTSKDITGMVIDEKIPTKSLLDVPNEESDSGIGSLQNVVNTKKYAKVMQSRVGSAKRSSKESTNESVEGKMLDGVHEEKTSGNTSPIKSLTGLLGVTKAVRKMSFKRNSLKQKDKTNNYKPYVPSNTKKDDEAQETAEDDKKQKRNDLDLALEKTSDNPLSESTPKKSPVKQLTGLLGVTKAVRKLSFKRKAKNNMSDNMEGAEETDDKQKENDGKRKAKQSKDELKKGLLSFMALEKTVAISNGDKTENDQPKSEDNVECENSYVDVRDQLSKLITDNMDSDRSLTPEIDETKRETDKSLEENDNVEQLDSPEGKEKIDFMKEDIKTQFGEVDLW